MRIKKEYWVEYAHRLLDHQRQCKYIHGHSGRVTITFEGPVMDDTGMVRDFGDLKWAEEIVNELDHALILQQNDPLIAVLEQFNDDKERPLPRDAAAQLVLVNGKPTAERLCLWIQDRIHQHLIHEKISSTSTHSLQVVKVEFEETRGNTAIWRR